MLAVPLRTLLAEGLVRAHVMEGRLSRAQHKTMERVLVVRHLLYAERGPLDVATQPGGYKTGSTRPLHCSTRVLLP